MVDPKLLEFDDFIYEWPGVRTIADRRKAITLMQRMFHASTLEREHILKSTKVTDPQKIKQALEFFAYFESVVETRPNFFRQYRQLLKTAKIVLRAIRNTSAQDTELFLDVLKHNRVVAHNVKAAFDYKLWLHPGFVESGRTGRLGSPLMNRRYLTYRSGDLRGIVPLLTFFQIHTDALDSLTPESFDRFFMRTRRNLHATAKTRSRFYMLEALGGFAPHVAESVVRRFILRQQDGRETDQKRRRLNDAAEGTMTLGAVRAAHAMLDPQFRQQQHFRNPLSLTFRLQNQFARISWRLPSGMLSRAFGNAASRQRFAIRASIAFNIAAGLGLVGMAIAALNTSPAQKINARFPEMPPLLKQTFLPDPTRYLWPLRP